MGQPVHYTHALWRVKPGHEDEFIAAWNAVADAFISLDRPPLWGTLLRSESEPNVFYSFGPWEAAEDVTAMRAHPAAAEAIGKAVALCDEATPANYSMVAHRTGRPDPA